MRFWKNTLLVLTLMSFAAQSGRTAEPTPISNQSPTPEASLPRFSIAPRATPSPLPSTAPAPGPKFGLTATGIQIMAGRVKAGEVCQKDLAATQDTLKKCQETVVPPESFLQKPVVIVLIAVVATVVGFGVAKLTQGSPSSSAAQPAAMPAALMRF